MGNQGSALEYSFAEDIDLGNDDPIDLTVTEVVLWSVFGDGLGLLGDGGFD